MNWEKKREEVGRSRRNQEGREREKERKSML